MKIRKLIGFTLIETTLAIFLFLSVVSISIGVLQQQLDFKIWIQAQDFILKDAPLINKVIKNSIIKTSSIQIFKNKEDALNNTNAQPDTGNSIKLNRATASGEKEAFIISFSPTNNSVDFNKLDPVTNNIIYSWNISKKTEDMSFKIKNNIIEIKLTGQNNEEINYFQTLTK